MQGINPLTGTCTYKTPCGWCTKWDKKCDKKIPERGKRATLNLIDDYISTTSANKMCQTEEDHQWEYCGISTVGSTYRCTICGTHKTVPFKDQDNTIMSTYYNAETDRFCSECDNQGWDMPECKECNTANNFKYFKRKKDTK